MIVAQVTDLHVVERGQKMKGMLDTNTMAAAAIEHVKALAPRPDVVLVTGDLADDGNVAQYHFLRELLDGMAIPYYVIPGNHDHRAPLLQVFEGHVAAAGDFLQYVIDDYPVRLIALDTLIEDRDDGLLCDRRLAWLDEALRGAPQRPTLIFMHHPPFETGVWWMDASGLSGSASLRAIVARHPQVQRIICGHVHRPIQTSWGATLISVAPSTAYQVHLDLVPESRPCFILEPPACQLHVFDGHGFVSHTSYVGWPQLPVDLSPMMGGWDLVRRELRARKEALR